MASLELTRSGIYAVRWRDSNGKNHSKSLKTKNRRVAKADLKRFEAELEGHAFGPKATRYTVDDLRTLYLEYADRYYRQDGEPTSEISIIRPALAGLDPYKNLDITMFTPKVLRKVREEWEHGTTVHGKRYARTTINKYVERIRRMFLWGVSEEIVPTDVAWALKSLPGLRRGRTEARETEKKEPLTPEEINAVQDNIADILRDIIQVQYLSAARPSEILNLRKEDFTVKDGPVWEAAIKHKMYYKTGKETILQFGPQAQKILSVYMERDTEYLFPTLDGTPYKIASYRRAIHRACDRAEITRWSPHRLRHTRLTEIRHDYGLEHAQAIGRHEKADTTEIYAQRNKDLAASILAEKG